MCVVGVSCCACFVTFVILSFAQISSFPLLPPWNNSIMNIITQSSYRPVIPMSFAFFSVHIEEQLMRHINFSVHTVTRTVSADSRLYDSPICHGLPAKVGQLLSSGVQRYELVKSMYSTALVCRQI